MKGGTTMNQKNLSTWLKGILIGAAICGLIVYAGILPFCSYEIVRTNPSYSGYFYPWMIFLWITAIPCYMALVYGWRIFTEIGRDNSFSYENAESLKQISRLALLDTVYFFIGNLIFLFLQMSHPGVVLLSLLVDFVGIAVTIVCAALSHLVYNAAALKEEQSLTI